MARKRNIRSMRFSDDIIEMIEIQQGRNFSEKFENLVTRCMWELPEKEKYIAELDKEIDCRYAEISKLKDRYIGLSRTLKLAEEQASDLVKSLYVAKRDVDL